MQIQNRTFIMEIMELQSCLYTGVLLPLTRKGRTSWLDRSLDCCSCLDTWGERGKETANFFAKLRTIWALLVLVFMNSLLPSYIPAIHNTLPNSRQSFLMMVCRKISPNLPTISLKEQNLRSKKARCHLLSSQYSLIKDCTQLASACFAAVSILGHMHQR